MKFTKSFGLRRATCNLALKDGWEVVTGHIFDAEGVELFIHRTINNDRTVSKVGWTVTCPVLGLGIYNGEKRDELIESTRSKMNSRLNYTKPKTVKELILDKRKDAGH